MTMKEERGIRSTKKIDIWQGNRKRRQLLYIRYNIYMNTYILHLHHHPHIKVYIFYKEVYVKYNNSTSVFFISFKIGNRWPIYGSCIV